MKKLIWGIVIGLMMLGIVILTVHVLAVDPNIEGSKNMAKPTSYVRSVSVRNNQADLVRICAEITKTKREFDSTETKTDAAFSESAAVESIDQNKDAELYFWLSKAGEYHASEEIVTFLYETLKREGIIHWMPYAMAQAFQESTFRPGAENKLDKGILQYRITYWPEVLKEHGYPEDVSIFDWRSQIMIYAADTARRLSSGLSVEETISRHKTSDYGVYDAAYVDQVMRWVTIEDIE